MIAFTGTAPRRAALPEKSLYPDQPSRLPRLRVLFREPAIISIARRPVQRTSNYKSKMAQLLDSRCVLLSIRPKQVPYHEPTVSIPHVADVGS